MFEQFLRSSRTYRRMERIAHATGNTLKVMTDGEVAVWFVNDEHYGRAETARKAMKPTKKEK